MKKISETEAIKLTNGVQRKYGKNSKVVEFVMKMKVGEYAYISKNEIVGRSALGTILHYYKTAYGFAYSTRETNDKKGWIIKKLSTVEKELYSREKPVEIQI